MDTFTKKRYATFNYTNRYAGMQYYYDTKAQKDVFGIVKPMIKNSAWFAHKVVQGDTLDSLALKYYNNNLYTIIIQYTIYVLHVLHSFDYLRDVFQY